VKKTCINDQGSKFKISSPTFKLLTLGIWSFEYGILNAILAGFNLLIINA